VVPPFLLDRYFALNIVVAERNHYWEEELMGRFVYLMNVSLDLRLEQRSFEQGVTMHRYAIRDVSEAGSC